jgi:DNA-binding response OmpR family regulator
MKILLVDDEIDILEFVKEFLESRNFEVITAGNGKEAIEMMDKETPDLVFLDVRMPVMDGLTLLRTIKDREQRPIIIIISAVEEITTIEQAQKLGADGYITKPLSLDELEDAVYRLSGETPE